MRGSSTLTRRRMLGTLGALGVAAASGVLAAPRPARAQPLGLNESVDVAMKRVFAGRPIRDGESLIKLDIDRKSTRLNSSHGYISYAVFCLKKKKKKKEKKENESQSNDNITQRHS